MQDARRRTAHAVVPMLLWAISLAALCYQSGPNCRAEEPAAAAPAAPAAVAPAADTTTAAAPAAPAAEKPATKEPDAKAKPGTVSGERSTTDVTEADQISFRQSKVAAEMTELEERMFRLAEALKALEPENSSRLMLGLKYAREELILHQMKETQQQLAKLSLGDAVNEQKTLLAKLQRLQDLLMSSDLDFQMRLEKLRTMREILRRLDTAIKEEDREKKASDETTKKEKELARLKKRRATLEDLVKQQTAHVGRGTELAKNADAGQQPGSEVVGKLGTAQKATEAQTKELAGQENASAADGKPGDAKPGDGKPGDAKPGEGKPGDAKASDAKPAEASAAAGSPLEEAAGQMDSAAQKLTKTDTPEKAPAAALPDMKNALARLEKELERTKADEAEKAKELATEKFAAMKKDQAGNRQFTDAMAEMTRSLGDSGAGPLGEMQRASGSMNSAEGALGNRQSDSAAEDQEKALAALKYAKDQLEDEADKLLDELRGEVKKRVMEGLTIMLEKQVMIRESTVSLAPRVEQGSRQALTSVVALSKNEGAIEEIANELITLVEETEFGIALPAALGVVRDQMENVKLTLAKGDASESVVAAEKQIEADLQSLMEAMKQLPSSKPSNKKPSKGGPQEKERELNRLVAELKMIRILQIRVNKDTTETDKQRAADAAALSTGIKKHIQELQGKQEDVRDVTEKLAAERGQEIQ